MNEICCDTLQGDPLLEAIHYRNVDVETALGVKIRQVDQAGSETNKSWQTWNETLATSVLTNTGDYDAASMHSYCGSVLALQNIYFDLYELGEDNGGYLDMSKPWWNQNAVDALTINGSLFMAGGSMLISDVARAFCIIYNKDLFNEKFPEEHYSDLYDMVDNKTWTIDKMLGYISQVWDDTNVSGLKDDGDTFGFQYGEWPTIYTWVYALGLDPVVRDTYGELALDYYKDPDLVTAFEKVTKLYNVESDGVMGGRKWTESTFENNKVMFSVGYIENGEALRNASVSYGILPLPMLNEDQSYYKTNTVGHVSMLGICSNLTEERIPMVTATIELMAAESYDKVIPAYYSKVLHGIYSKEEVDSRMYDLVIESTTFDFATCYFPFSNTTLRQYFLMFDNAKSNAGFDIAAYVDSYDETWEIAFEEMMEQFREITD